MEKINIEKILNEIKQGEETGRDVKMWPICQIYETVDHRAFINYVRDYIWHDDLSCLGDTRYGR